jgi:hypothetical protein
MPYDEEAPPPVQDDESEASCVSASSSSSSSSSPPPHRHHQPPRPPSNYICPLTLEVMNEPVNDGCGHCFDRDAIVAWLEYHEMCPISRKPITRRELHPSPALRRRIRDWKRSHAYNEEQQQQLHELQYDGDGVELVTTTTTTYPRNDTYSPMELILLPQERKMLGNIKIRAHALRRQRRKERIIWSIGGVVTGVIVIILTLVVKNMGGEFHGSI